MFLGKSSIHSIICTWFLVVAGFPLYYLMPDRDWTYEYWGAPAEIVQSSKSAENPGEKHMQGVYARIFIVRPSARNLSNFRAAGFTTPWMSSCANTHCPVHIATATGMGMGAWIMWNAETDLYWCATIAATKAG